MASDTEWGVLITHLGGPNNAGGALKASGTALWDAPNEGATNASGFSALPAGKRDSNLDFVKEGESGSWWTATEHSVPFARERVLTSGSDDALGGYYGDKNNGHAVRCVKD
ncbi:MAG: fibrobacter succinogenes major paralogous domain-containing protein [Flavobacteriales bacterium]|nr:fibrobacter succinogenes major paralogous domain-containing protein [Flavobacteriales bacterium]